VIRYEDLNAGHFQEWGVEDFPHPSRIMGFAVRRDERLVAIGLVWIDDQDRWWGNFDQREGCPHKVHAEALKLLWALDRAGVPEVWADCNYEIPRADVWLERLGFRPVDEAKKVWRRELHLQGSRGERAAQGL